MSVNILTHSYKPPCNAWRKFVLNSEDYFLQGFEYYCLNQKAVDVLNGYFLAVGNPARVRYLTLPSRVNNHTVILGFSISNDFSGEPAWSYNKSQLKRFKESQEDSYWGFHE